MTLKAIALNGTLKSSAGEPSSTDRMLDLIAHGLRENHVEVATIRLAGHGIKPGVTSDEGPGDAWPDLRKAILGANIKSRDTDLAGAAIFSRKARSGADGCLPRGDG